MRSGSIKVAIVRGQIAHVDAWAALRSALWPGHTHQEHADDLRELLDRDGNDAFGFVAQLPDDSLVAFTEASLRRDYVNGCSSSPVLFLEGIYVQPAYRRMGIGQSLFEAVKALGRSSGCSEFASDAALENLESQAFHKALGFKETERVVYFHQPLS